MGLAAWRQTQLRQLKSQLFIAKPIFMSFSALYVGTLLCLGGLLSPVHASQMASAHGIAVSGIVTAANSASTLQLSHPQFNEAACILLADQIARFKSQSHLTLYKKSVRDYERHCQRAQPTGAQSASSPSVDMRGDTSAWGTSQAKEELSESGTDVSLASVSSANTAAMITSAARPESSVANSQLGTATTSGADAAFWHTVFDPQQGAAQGVLAPLMPLLQQLWLFALAIPLWLWVIVLTCVVAMPWRGSLTKQERLGREAEQQLARLLRQSLPDDCQHYRNLVLHSDRGDLTEIDHLVLSPQGVFVIEVKNFQGFIMGHEFQPTWTQSMFGNKTTFQNPLRQNYKHTQAVAALLQLDEQQASTMIHSVIAFGRRGTLKTNTPSMVMYLDEVPMHIQQIQHHCEPHLWFSQAQLQQFNTLLGLALEQAPVLRQAHKLQEQSKAMVRSLH